MKMDTQRHITLVWYSFGFVMLKTEPRSLLFVLGRHSTIEPPPQLEVVL